MNLNIFQSLQTRVIAFVLALFLVGIWALAFYASRMLREDMQRQLGEQQFSIVLLLAAQVNEELDGRLRALKAVAAGVAPAMMGKPAALQALLEQRPVLQPLFNGGITILSLDGTTIADVPLSAGRIGVNFMDRDHVAAALKEGQSTIGRPLMGRVQKMPIISLAVPIRDAQGKVIGALAGVINLGLPNFLSMIMEQRYGQTGGYVIIAPQHALTVIATDKARVMTPTPAPGINPLMDRYVRGFEGYGSTVDSLGVEVSSAAKRIPVAGWFLVGRIPTAEAFAPIRDLQQHILIAAILLSLLIGASTWWMLRHQLAPVFDTAETLATLSASDHPAQPLPIARQDEIGQLIGGFNRLLESLTERGKALKESEGRFRAVVEYSPEAISVHRDGKRVFVNPAAVKLFGATSAQDLIDKLVLDQMHPDYHQIVQARLNNVSALDDSSTIERRLLKLDGTPVDVEVHRSAIVYEGQAAVLVSIRDITERKQMEDQVRHMAFHDTLTKLANRRLLNDRLSQAMAASKRSGCHGALMFLDLDNFKLLNDTQGHEVGDLLLIEAADRLKSCVREVDTVARFGGDEFVVMVSGLSVDRSESIAQAGVIVEKIRTALAKPYALHIRHEGTAQTTVEHQCTASIGVALFGRHSASQEDILKWADTAMYQAKTAGNDLIRFHDSNTSAKQKVRT